VFTSEVSDFRMTSLDLVSQLIDDLPDVTQCMLRFFANDTKDSVGIRSPEDCKLLVLQNDLDNLCDWSQQWQLDFNAEKCKVLHHGVRNPRFQYTMTKQGKVVQLASVSEEKDLGVTFQEGLDFNQHIAQKVKKSNQMAGMLYRTFNHTHESMFVTLFKSMVRPHVEYCSTVWSPYKLKEIRLIEGVQRKATKMVKSIRHLSYPDRLRKLGLPTLEYRRCRADMIQVYKIFTNLDDADPSSFFNLQGAQTRGHAYKIRKVHSRTLKRSKSFSQPVITTWNALPEPVVTAPTLNQFKSRLNDHWRNIEMKFQPS
jgi:ribonuclease P/MRP protein subunit RPP40